MIPKHLLQHKLNDEITDGHQCVVLALTDSNIVPADFGRLKVKDQSINKRMIGTYEGNISGDKDI